MAMREDTLRSLTWLEYYGLMRAWGKSPAESAAFCDTPPENTEEALAAAARLFSRVQGMQTEALWEFAKSGAAMLPMVGGLLAQGLTAVYEFAAWLGRQLSTGLDQECSTARPESYNRRNFIGVAPAPLGSHNMFVMPFALHDGLLALGPGRPNTPDAFGPKVGVCAVPDHGGAEQWFRAWARLHPYYAPQGIDQGDYQNPWNQPGNNWYWRSKKVHSILTWCEHKMPCRLLASMYFILKAFYNAPNAAFPRWYERQGTSNGLGAVENSALDEMRRKGGRWFTSIYMMQRDFWRVAHERGLPRLEEVLTQVGASGAITAFRENWLATGIDGDTGLSDDYAAWSPTRSINPWTRAMGSLTWQPLMDGLKLLVGAPVVVQRIASTPALSVSAAQLQAMRDNAASAAAASRAGASETQSSGASASSLTRYALPAGAALGAIGLVWFLTRGK